MPRYTILLVFLSALSFASAPSAAPIDLWGIKNCDGDAQCPAVGDGSTIPAHIFQVRSDGTGFVDHGQILLGQDPVDADGLAWSSQSPSTLFGFRIEHGDPNRGKDGTASQLITMDVSSPTAAAAVGVTHAGRDIRGAAFDVDDRLWALDAALDEILRIDPLTGAILDSGSLLEGGVALDIRTGADIAFRPDGSAVMVSGFTFYELILGAKTVASLFTDTGFHAGLVHEPMSGDLVSFEVNGTDDLFRSDAGGTRTRISTPPFPFNAGRGDLAALVDFDARRMPAPGVLVLLAMGLLPALARRRARAVRYAA